MVISGSTIELYHHESTNTPRDAHQTNHASDTHARHLFVSLSIRRVRGYAVPGGLTLVALFKRRAERGHDQPSGRNSPIRVPQASRATPDEPRIGLSWQALFHARLDQAHPWVCLTGGNDAFCNFSFLTARVPGVGKRRRRRRLVHARNGKSVQPRIRLT